MHAEDVSLKSHTLILHWPCLLKMILRFLRAFQHGCILYSCSLRINLLQLEKSLKVVSRNLFWQITRGIGSCFFFFPFPDSILESNLIVFPVILIWKTITPPVSPRDSVCHNHKTHLLTEEQEYRRTRWLCKNIKAVLHRHCENPIPYKNYTTDKPTRTISQFAELLQEWRALQELKRILVHWTLHLEPFWFLLWGRDSTTTLGNNVTYLTSKWKSQLTQCSYVVTKGQFTSLHHLEVPPCGAKLSQKKSVVPRLVSRTVFLHCSAWKSVP